VISIRAKSAFFHSLAGLIALSMGAILLAAPLTAWSQSVRAREETARILTIETITVADGAVSGEVVNRSSNTVRDVQLFIRYTWLWDNETKPGKDDPSTIHLLRFAQRDSPRWALAFHVQTVASVT
jgi:hypothetical protein